MIQKHFACLLALALTLLVSASVNAQEFFNYIAPDLAVDYDPMSGAVNFDATVQIEEIDSAAGSLTQGFSFGLRHEPSELVCVDFEDVGELEALGVGPGGSGPGFFGKNIYADGWTVGVVYNFLGGVFITFDVPKDMVTANYDTVAAFLLNDMDGATAALTWADDLGVPAVANVVVVGGASLGTTKIDGTITFSPVIDVPFIRGDVNQDLIVNIADGVWILNELFQSGPANLCAEAGDVNSDGMYDSTDAVYIFNYRFLAGPPPAAPFPDCAPVSGADCGDYPVCL